jgi:hypothetical protein
MRITVLHPPDQVLFRVQRGKTNFENPDLLTPVQSTRQQMTFDFSVRIGARAAGKPPNFLGTFVQGPSSARFVYVNSGTLAGQRDSCWSRRAKVHLTGITWKQIEDALGRPGVVLEARIEGTGCDGSPACATVPLIGGGWQLTR